MALRSYLQGIRNIHVTGEAVEETSYYGQLERLLNDVGKTLSPAVTCVLTTRNRGAGVPDGGLFVARQAVAQAGDSVLLARAPERGVMEVKGPGKEVRQVARSAQVRRYLERYGKVLVCNYRDFLVLRLGSDGQAHEGERFTLAPDENSFWALAPQHTEDAHGQEFTAFLARALLGDAPLSNPADLAYFLAAYARTALARIEDGGEMQGIATLRGALEEALGLRFEGEDGEHFFRSALVQTLFYGVFAAWVFWSEHQPETNAARFTWRQAQWTLSVPMVRVLFQQLASPANLPVGLDEVLDWTDDVLARIDRKLFLDRFEAAEAVQYFYEPFLQAYDPDLRRELGVWYTPPEVVKYMVPRIDRALREELGLELGLADENVHVLDPCTGTGSYLTEVIATVVRTLKDRSGDGLVPAEAKRAALSRIHGFELLPAPFVIAHLQIGLALQRFGAPLDADADERASIYLTNSLTGWVAHDQIPLPFPEFEAERDAAENVKREQPILVVLGNPPYNGFAGVSGRDEGGLVEPYKERLASDWHITKNKLDDLYIRFLRVAERRIAEQTGRGIVCFISNFSWLGDPSAVVMRERLLREFDSITIDSLNGDSRETGKKTPEGDPDPSIFSTRLNPPGIQVGTAISLLVRKSEHDDEHTQVRYRDFWGQTKREQLTQAIENPDSAPAYEELRPEKANWYRLRRWAPRHGYELWPALTDLCGEKPMLGLNENRAEALSDHDKEVLLGRMRRYLDAAVPLRGVDERLRRQWSGFEPETVRQTLLSSSPFEEERAQRFLVRPFDIRYAYIDTTAKLWNRSRPLLVAAAALESDFLVVRRRAPRALDGAAMLHSRCLVDQHAMHKDAYVIPLWLAGGTPNDGNARLFEDSLDGPVTEWRPNLSQASLDYVSSLGIEDANTNRDSAALIWLHALAVGFSPLYVEENDDAVRSNWPRVPLPDSEPALRESARLGARVAALLDLDGPVRRIDGPPVSPSLRTVAAIGRDDGAAVNPDTGDLAVTAGWGVVQTRAIMPGAGRTIQRERTDAERAGLSDENVALLGEQVLDVYLGTHARWAGVPAAAWDFKIGGFQVLRKWLSYRESRVLGRDLTMAEARAFTTIARRLTELVLLGAKLDANSYGRRGSEIPCRRTPKPATRW
jgi:hypothetical protein